VIDAAAAPADVTVVAIAQGAVRTAEIAISKSRLALRIPELATNEPITPDPFETLGAIARVR
jgi:hypothetical protein